MVASSGFFCAHKRLRTSCPECRPPPPEPKPKPAAAPRATTKAAPDPDEAFKRRELLPLRSKPRRKPASREEAESADAWWVKK